MRVRCSSAIRFCLCLFALLLATLQVRSADYYQVHVLNGPYGLGGSHVSVSQSVKQYIYGIYNTTVSSSGSGYTDGNGNITIGLASYNNTGFPTYITYSVSFSIAVSAPSGYTLNAYGASGSGGAGGFTYSLTRYVSTGPLNGQVRSGGVGLNATAVYGSASGSVAADANGNYSLGHGPAQTVTASKAGVTFPGGQTIYPGHSLIINAVSGVIKGTVSPGAADTDVSGVTLNVADNSNPGALICQGTSDSSGNYSSCNLSASPRYRVTRTTRLRFLAQFRRCPGRPVGS